MDIQYVGGRKCECPPPFKLKYLFEFVIKKPLLSTTYERYSNLSTYYYGYYILLKLLYSCPKILSSSGTQIWVPTFRYTTMAIVSGSQMYQHSNIFNYLHCKRLSGTQI